MKLWILLSLMLHPLLSTAIAASPATRPMNTKRPAFFEQLRCTVTKNADKVHIDSFAVYLNNKGLEELLFASAETEIATNGQLLTTQEVEPALVQNNLESNLKITGTRKGITKASLQNMSQSIELKITSDITKGLKVIEGNLTRTPKIVATAASKSYAVSADFSCDVVGHFRPF